MSAFFESCFGVLVFLGFSTAHQNTKTLNPFQTLASFHFPCLKTHIAATAKSDSAMTMLQ